jgi:hypothetical protein
MAWQGHPEAMKMTSRHGYFHTSAWNKNSANFAHTEFSEVRELGILGSSA